MRKQYIFIFLILLLNSFFVLAHSGKARYHVIIETNGKPNDLRTISLCLASKEIEVIGIYCTKEEFETTDAEAVVNTLLQEYHHEGVPIGSSYEFLEHLYQNEDEAITYVCLTSLRSLAEEVCINPLMKGKTELVIWFAGESGGSIGFNHQFFPEGYSKIKDCALNMVHLSYGDNRIAALDKKFLKKAEKIESRYTAQLDEVEHITSVSEELTAVYLQNPAIFEETESVVFPGDLVYRPKSHISVRTAYLEMLREKQPDYKILSHIPLDAEYYQSDIASIIDSIVVLYGETEWRAGVLSFELHGHIGIYAIIGVKMGLRAREYFNIGLDDLYIESHAGLSPPYSCLNDGLQVSTGSSLGHGLIHAEATSSPGVSATFAFKGKSVLISLKEHIVSRMKHDIQACITENGMLTPAYWTAVRELALTYWYEYDRNQIFTITQEN